MAKVIKTRRNDRIVKVERRAVIGAGRLKQALRDSEDSVKLNTSFVEPVKPDGSSEEDIP
jgi:hypothetical protein